jgi:hypothetical protein
MTRLFLALDRRGTAAIEFALILPVMMLLGVSLVDTVLGNLVMIDVEMAADVGARVALHTGSTRYQVVEAMAGLGVAGLEPKMTVFQCGSKEKGDDNGKQSDDNDNGQKRLASEDLTMHDGEACEMLPYGRYMRIIAAVHRKSLFGAARSSTITAITQVRLP